MGLYNAAKKRAEVDYQLSVALKHTKYMSDLLTQKTINKKIEQDRKKNKLKKNIKSF